MADSNPDDDNFNDAQRATLRALYIISILLFAFNLAFALHNAIKYPMRGRKGAKIVIIFYVLAILLCLSEIGRNFLFAIDVVSYSILWTPDDGVDFWDVTALVVFFGMNFCMIAICIQVIVNIIQVLLALRRDLDKISADSAYRWRKISYAVAIGFSILSPFLLFIVPFTSADYEQEKNESIVFMAIYLVLIVSYSVAIVFLYSSIKGLNNVEKFSSI